jgi:Kef-type K+ transport system membrane component KefB/nucleotide-binding universal stress UspA family protein
LQLHAPEPLPLFVIQVAAIIAACRAVGLLARRVGQPMVIAEVVAGIALGPSLLGAWFPEFSAWLFPADSLPRLSLVAQVGLVFFMFLVGLEMDPRMLRGQGMASVAISISSIVVPLLSAFALAVFAFPRVAPPGVPFASFALFLGVAMSITAFPVLARILSERGILRSRVGAITIAAAAVDDVAAWCMLAFVVSVTRAHGLGQAVRTTVLAVAFCAFMLLLVRPFLARLAQRAGNRDALSQNMVAVILLLLLLSAAATEAIGIHALFGGFLMGASMPRGGGFAEILTEKMEDFVVVFLLPLFFAYSGLRTHVGLLDSPHAWVLCGLVIAVACAGKFGGAAIAARLTGLSWREASGLGILMNTRGLVELIVLNIGLDLGVISPALFTMMVLMALFTTFATTPLIQLVLPDTGITREQRAPPPVPAEGYSVLVCVSDPSIGPAMATVAAAIGGPDDGAARLLALHLVRPPERPSVYLREDVHEQSEAALRPLLDRGGELGTEFLPRVGFSVDPGTDIARLAEEQGADLVLLGSHKPLLGRTVMGGTVYDVLAGARCDVAVLIDHGLPWIRRVLVPYYGSEHDRGALRLAERISEGSGSELTVLHVVTPRTVPAGDPDATPDATPREPSLASPAAAAAAPSYVFRDSEGPGPDRVLRVVEHGDPTEAALAEAKNGYDLVVVGSGPRWGLEQRHYAANPERIVQECPTSLLIVRKFSPWA